MSLWVGRKLCLGKMAAPRKRECKDLSTGYVFGSTILLSLCTCMDSNIVCDLYLYMKLRETSVRTEGIDNYLHFFVYIYIYIYIVYALQCYEV